MRAIAFAILALLFRLTQLSQRHRKIESVETNVAFTVLLAASLFCIFAGW